MKEKGVGAVSGIETLRVLAGAVGVADFTVNSLAVRTGVARRTVDTVLRRYQADFQRLDHVSAAGGRGRPAIRWQLRPTAVDKVVAEVARLQATAPSRPPATPDPDLVEASLAMAVDSIMRTRASEPEEALILVGSARSSILATGLDLFADTDAANARADLHDCVWRARLIDAVADVVEAEATGGIEQVDKALARALPIVRDCRPKLSADEWLPLANRTVEAAGTVLAAPVEVIADDSQKLFQRLFPHLSKVSADTVDIEYEQGRPQLAETSVLADERIALGSSATATRPTVMFDVRTGPGAAEQLRSPGSRSAFNGRRVTRRPVLAEIIDTATISANTDTSAQFLLVGSDLRRGVARVVNRRAVGLDTGLSDHYLLVRS